MVLRFAKAFGVSVILAPACPATANNIKIATALGTRGPPHSPPLLFMAIARYPSKRSHD